MMYRTAMFTIVGIGLSTSTGSAQHDQSELMWLYYETAIEALASDDHRGDVPHLEINYPRALERALDLSRLALPEFDRFPADSADELFLKARSALRRGHYQEAADLFQEVQTRFPESSYVGQAIYFEAFSLNRLGGEAPRRRAIDLLEGLGDDFPDVADQAASLRMQIIGRLGRRGDADAVAQLAYAANGIASTTDAERAVIAASRAMQATNDSRIAVRASAQAMQNRLGVIASGSRLAYGQRTQESGDVRLQALNALLQMNSENAMPILRRLLQNRVDDNLELRRRAVFLVAQKRGEGREEILLDAARNDPDAEVQEQAVFYLSQVRTDAAVDALDSILQNSTEGRLQERAIFALSQHRSDRAGDILQRYVRRSDAPADLRASAIQWIGQRRGSEVFLRELYPELEDQELKEKVFFALAQRRSVESAQFIISIATDETETIEIRKQALFWAGQMRVANDQLLDLYDQVDDKEMKEQLIFVYGQRRDSPAVNRLIDIARDGSHADLQGKAIFWLGQSRDPRALVVLEELINREEEQ